MNGYAVAPDGRRGRAFSIRVEEAEERELRETLARLQLLPHDLRPEELFGYNMRRRHGSFGAFIVWAARQYKAPDPAKVTPARPRPRARSHPPRARRSHRPSRAAKKTKKGGRR